MDKETLRKVQLTQLEISKEIKRVCDENEIEYWLDSGTLLGAVRHKGFIPWDDDLDIGMRRESYEKFLQIAPSKLKPEFFLQTSDTDEGYGLTFAKVRKLNTIYIERSAEQSKAHNELYVDIFPYDVFPDNEIDQKQQGKMIMLYRYLLQMKCGYKPWMRKTGVARIMGYIKYIPFRIKALTKDKKDLIAENYKYMTQFNCIKTGRLFEETAGTPYGKWVISEDCFEEMCELSFEGILFSCPKNYDKYLKEAYGDYMKLPPEDKRENRHQIVEIKL